MNKIEIDMFVAKFKSEMNFETKKQEYNFKTKMNEYSKRDSFNLTYELFKLCIEKDKQLAEKDKQLANRPVEEVKPKTEKDILLDYKQQIENMPGKYTKPNQMEEFNDIMDKMETYVCDLEAEEENEDLVDELYADIEDVKDKIINKFGVAVDDWTWWDSDKTKNKMIYSPQSYKEYIESIDKYIKDNTGVGAMRMNNFKETEILQNKELKQLLKSFKK
jgi:hypothetical protein